VTFGIRGSVNHAVTSASLSDSDDTGQEPAEMRERSACLVNCFGNYNAALIQPTNGGADFI
jgi:hypothetical protein